MEESSKTGSKKSSRKTLKSPEAKPYKDLAFGKKGRGKPEYDKINTKGVGGGLGGGE